MRMDVENMKAKKDVNDELVALQNLLDKSLDAHTFVESTKKIGFEFVEESPFGLTMKSTRGSYMLAILRSIHPSNIACLVYLDKNSKKTIYLVDSGERKY
jgi:predicted HAD superfamily hydrolase